MSIWLALLEKMKKRFADFQSVLAKRHFRVDILFIFVSLFVTIIAIIIFYTYVNQTKALLKLSEQLISRTQKAVVADINEYLRPSTILEASANLLQIDHLTLAHDRHITSFMDGLIKANPDLMMIYITNRTGDYISERELIQGQDYKLYGLPPIPQGARYVTEIIDRSGVKPTVIWYFKNNQGIIIKKIKQSKYAFDPRKQLWFQSTIQRHSRYFTEVYKIANLDKKGIMVAYPSFDSKGKINGVIGVEFKLDSIDDFLDSQPVSPNGVSFISNSQGQLISYSQPNYDPPHYAPTALQERGKISLFSIHDIAAPQVIEAYQHYQQTKAKRFSFSFQGIKYIAAFQVFPKLRGEGWILGMVIPINDYVASVVKSNYFILFISTIILLAGIALIVLASRRISRPIERLAEETGRMQLLELDKPLHLKTHIIEVELMRDAVVSMKSSLQSFSKYVPQEVVKFLYQSGEVAKLHTRKKDLTVMFSDVTGFTNIVESISDKELSALLTEYLGELSEIIKQQDGTIDKYIGDAVMAFWGAPLPDSQHVTHACRAALLCKHKVDELNQRWLGLQKPILKTRFGISTGQITIGNIGYQERMNYTVIGDHVNLAARLEGANKLYGTQIIVSEEVRKLSKTFLFRPVDSVKVKGRLRTTCIYELVGDRQAKDHTAPTVMQRQVCKITQEAFTAYLKNDYEAALALYTQLAKLMPADRVAQVYIKRCKQKKRA